MSWYSIAMNVLLGIQFVICVLIAIQAKKSMKQSQSEIDRLRNRVKELEADA